ncbi:unnamed protein product [Penicillium camemberti]|uniref:Str. FM013 n=1 Tax=Penicillium camemberti (strain FM 013) TaxID=1429867 RepID=A0A0G4P5L3_PENC3|nr:unnamed protein product [Penicillium camemberti]
MPSLPDTNTQTPGKRRRVGTPPVVASKWTSGDSRI